MKVWSFTDGVNTGWVDMNIGDKVTVFRCSSGHSCFGEGATLARTTSQHLVFVTDSGAEVKTKIDNLFVVVGKAAKAGYVVSRKQVEDFDCLYKEHVSFWNSKKMQFEKK